MSDELDDVIPCPAPACKGRGKWVGSDNKRYSCGDCGGTGKMLASEADDLRERIAEFRYRPSLLP